ncbi:MAG: ROK family protein [Acidimicrobiales bacterium]
MKVLGIDIGGTGIKGAVVDTNKGVFKTDRLRILTPHPATPDAVAEVVGEIVDHFEWEGPVGCTFPGVVTHGVIRTAANLDHEWIGLQASSHLGRGRSMTVLNDADAAGLAEATFGGGGANKGVVLLLTLGTGIGSALMYHGKLVPNSELGHLSLHGGDAEKYAAESARERDGLSYEEWAGRLSEYLQLVEDLLWPDLFVLGGGISKQPDPWLPLVECRTPVTTARLKNKAGIIGAALQARHHAEHEAKDKGGKKK